ncbi:ArgE/DapE family deacylase [Listeria cornellensis]|uniref:Probable succinyl-diaminopimelate desuccinylase n=1 Tax=Listeria cornellensis FSL F6-0969 TaxID=1265820 RepID=W7BU21_9LIST|nr:ArgE/DapE family deacylase [Listeria cornellensis]EUJ30249.1 succinyl-diaminopimelate desuccinylase [Listeria cornellensis FSL F6-0969]
MNKQEKLAILKDMINIDSTNGNEEEVADYLLKQFAKYGILSEKVAYSEARTNLVSKIGGKNGKVLGFSGHMDVVDAGDRKAWKTPPFQATESDGKLFGRGSTDMKSGLAAMVIAMIELEQEGKLIDGQIKLLATIGEEIGEIGAAQLTTLGYADDLDGLIIGEPSVRQIIYAHKGSMNYTLVSYGKNAHSSTPELGINAIDNLMLFYKEVEQYVAGIHQTNDILGVFTHNVTVIEGGNQVNSIPARAQLQGNIRTIPEVDNEKTEQVFCTIVSKLNKQEGVHLEITWDYNKMPVFSDPKSNLVKIAESIAKEQFGKTIPIIGLAGTTDAAEFIKAKNQFPLIIFGPGNNTPHEVNEYVDIENYLEMIDVYKAIAIQFLK